MKVMKKFADKQRDIANYPGVTLAFLGDSVTQGCFEPLRKAKDRIEPVFDQEQAYHHRLARMLSVLYPKVPVNIINAGISGDGAPGGLRRVEKDVLRHDPDLAVVCFGLGDSFGGFEGIDRYVQGLNGIFDKLQDAGIETIFMTPCMTITRVPYDMTDPLIRKTYQRICDNQNGGVLTAYVNAAKQLCEKRGIRVCDCYAKWQTLERYGVDISDHIDGNHPKRYMHELFAVSLLETMLTD